MVILGSLPKTLAAIAQESLLFWWYPTLRLYFLPGFGRTCRKRSTKFCRQRFLLRSRNPSNRLVNPLTPKFKKHILPTFNPFTPKSDQFQISPAASPEISHHTVWRTWLFITYWDERWSLYQFSLHHLHIFSFRGWENALFELGSERVKRRMYKWGSENW